MSSPDVWTGWLNVDRPWRGEGDFETVDKIKDVYGKICEKGYEITAARCRVTNQEGAVFYADVQNPGDQFLRTHCTKEGLVCRNEDQWDGPCKDYSIMFRCSYTGGNESIFPEFDVRIYIILAVVPILIFLIRILWAYVFRRRRMRRRYERRARQRLNRGDSNDDELEPDDDSSSVASALANPPPSYKDLFGEAGKSSASARSSIFAISRENVPVCAKCKSISCSVAMIVNGTGIVSNTYGESPNRSNSQNSGNSGSSNSSSSSSNSGSSSTCAGATAAVVSVFGVGQQVGDTRTDLSTGSPGCNVNSVEIEMSASVSSSNSQTADDVRTPTSTTKNTDSGARASETGNIPDEPCPPYSAHNVHIENEVDQGHLASPPSATRSRSSSGDVSQDAIISEASSSTNLTSLSIPLASSISISQPCACTCHRTVPFRHQGVEGYDNAAFDNDDTDIGTETPVQRPTLPGMHVPVPGLPRVNSRTSVVTLTELPSYEDALELMKKKKEEEAADTKGNN